MKNRTMPSATVPGHGSVVLWKPRKAAGPLEDYQFADRAEHEAAFAWAAQFGPQPGMPSADVLPPLPHTAPELAALASALPDGTVGSWGRFQVIATATNDPRVPWRDPPQGLAQRVEGDGYVVILGLGAGSGWHGILLHADLVDGVTEHLLVHAQSSRRVRFGDRLEAVRALQPVVNAGGNLPDRWAWDPRIEGTVCPWTPLPPDKKRWPNAARITKQG
jgi:hypothetical protein